MNHMMDDIDVVTWDIAEDVANYLENTINNSGNLPLKALDISQMNDEDAMALAHFVDTVYTELERVNEAKKHVAIMRKQSSSRSIIKTHKGSSFVIRRALKKTIPSFDPFYGKAESSMS